MQISCCRSELTSFVVFVVDNDDVVSISSGSDDISDAGDHESLSETTRLLSLSLSLSLSFFLPKKMSLKKINP